MEKVAQGRVWTGKDAASQGLVDAIGGLSRAIAIAKQQAGIPQDRKVNSWVSIDCSREELRKFGVKWTCSGFNIS